VKSLPLVYRNYTTTLYQSGSKTTLHLLATVLPPRLTFDDYSP